ncbi:hypothetical protein LNQ49_12835 [Flavobacterium sp. F-65]|uniref:Uncharacterized protein n=1 Tax=Flavobacterium pisciphilum TaxID=2893755 RepID=A0ABS8MUP1_9FLAO|nr:hypothetical protein [Flavobacterium sp. F-65]MCC9072469.1 hypothetical protein [Flavobacterium sp. F-65]
MEQITKILIEAEKEQSFLKGLFFGFLCGMIFVLVLFLIFDKNLQHLAL